MLLAIISFAQRVVVLLLQESIVNLFEPYINALKLCKKCQKNAKMHNNFKILCIFIVRYVNI